MLNVYYIDRNLYDIYKLLIIAVKITVYTSFLKYMLYKNERPWPLILSPCG